MSSTRIVWLKLSRWMQYRIYSVAQQPAVEPVTRYGTHWRQWFKRTRAFAIWAAWTVGGTTGDADLRNRGFWYGGDHISLGIGTPLDAVSMNDPQQRFATGKKNAAAVDWRSHAPKRSPRAQHPLPRQERTLT